MNQKEMYTKKNGNSNYLVCGYCWPGIETVRLDKAMQIAEQYVKRESEVRIHEFITGDTWYYENS